MFHFQNYSRIKEIRDNLTNAFFDVFFALKIDEIEKNTKLYKGLIYDVLPSTVLHATISFCLCF